MTGWKHGGDVALDLSDVRGPHGDWPAGRPEDGAGGRPARHLRDCRARLHAYQRLPALAGAKDIPIGTSYAVWTGIGAAGTFIYGILFYGDAAGVARSIGVRLILLGVVTLKLSHE
jgi:hypothetical protein